MFFLCYLPNTQPKQATRATNATLNAVLSQQMHNSMCPHVYPHMTYKLALLSPFFPAIDSRGVDAKNPRDLFTGQPEATQPDC